MKKEAALADLVNRLARFSKDGEEDAEGEEFILENDDAVRCLHWAIDLARFITSLQESK